MAKLKEQGFVAVRHCIIRDRTIGGYTKLVYIIIADHSDENNLSFPSVSTIAAEAGCTPKTALKAIRELITKGLITREHRALANGGTTSCLYHLEEPRNFKANTERARQSDPDMLDKTLYQAPESTTTVEPTREPAPTEPSPHKREEYPTAFEQLWAIYPKHVAKMAAYKAWRKAKVGMNSAFLLVKVQAFAAQCANTETRFIPNFATWLNGERWNDEYRPDPPQSRKPVTNAERNMRNLTQVMQSGTDLFGFQIESGVSRP